MSVSLRIGVAFLALGPYLNFFSFFIFPFFSVIEVLLEKVPLGFVNLCRGVGDEAGYLAVLLEVHVVRGAGALPAAVGDGLAAVAVAAGVRQAARGGRAARARVLRPLLLHTVLTLATHIRPLRRHHSTVFVRNRPA